MGRQYIGEIGKTDNGIVVVTTHLYDGRKSLPLDIELYQHANSLPSGKQDPEFEKKTEERYKVDRQNSQSRISARDSDCRCWIWQQYIFLLELENRQLKYLGGFAKNRKVTVNQQGNNKETIRLVQHGKNN